MGIKGLIVEDDYSIAVLLQEILKQGGYDVRVAGDGKEGLREFFAFQPDVVLLDITMPQMDGWTLLGRIREMSQTPVIIITSQGTESNKIRGLSGGADDYIVKPFSPKEVLARIEAVMRRAGKHQEAVQHYQDAALTIDHGQHRVFVYGTEIDLTPTEFKLISVLSMNAGQVIPQERLLDLVWGMEEGGLESVRLYVSYLRKKLSEAGGEDLVQTVRGVGYRYAPPGTPSSKSPVAKRTSPIAGS